jgi:hypothetical protein
MTATPTESFPTVDSVVDGDAQDASTADDTAQVDEAPTLSKEDRAAALRKSYGEATAIVRDENRDRFEELYEERAKANGVKDYTRPLSAEKKAEKALADLLEAHPHLADKVEFKG